MSAIILYQSLTLFAEAGSLNQTQSGGGINTASQSY